MPIQLMAAHPNRAGLTMADVVVQLRCRECGQRPASIAFLEDGAARARGRMGAQGWWVTLVGEDTPGQ